MTGAVTGGRRGGADLAAAALLALLVVAAFLPVTGASFLRYDDALLVTENPALSGGLSSAAVRWAFAAPYEGNWVPLAWLSHALDATLFGLAPAWHHGVNLLLHAANAVLLLRLLLRLTGARGPSCAAAALVALHPLAVESVAWVAQRKGLLMLLFGLLALHAWAAWLRRRTPGRYALALLLFACALASKPLIVTLPLLMLLLDWWPLGRFGGAAHAPPRALLLEKAPLFALALAAGAVALAAQRGAMVLESRLAAPEKALHALSSLPWYIGKALWPAGLAVFYPYPLGGLSAAAAFGGALLLAGGTAGAFLARRRAPQLATGWLWFLVALAPAAGLVQVGEQAHADRYAYLALPGLGLLAAWGATALGRRLPALRRLLPWGAGAALAALGCATFLQARHWRDDGTLLTHALAVTEGNYVAHNNLGARLFRAGDLAGAKGHFEAAVRLAPRPAKAHANLGQVLLREGRVAEALGEFREALRLDPREDLAHRGLGQALERLGRPEEAAAAYREALRLRPGDPRAEALLRRLLQRRGEGRP